MKRTHVVLSIAPVLLTCFLAGCKSKEIAPGNSAGATPSVTANANSPVASGAQSGATPPVSGPAKLIGTYEAREIENKGVVTLVSQIKTIMVFTAEFNYSRVSQANGKLYHSDSGHFRIEAPDRLVLTIQVVNKNIKSPPAIVTHKYSLSPNGDELKLTSEKGTATYQRTSQPKVS